MLPTRLQSLPEKEAKTIVAQILGGLVYLNTKPRSVIHYDLKPANILFDCNGECKITVSRGGPVQGALACRAPGHAKRGVPPGQG